MPCLHYPARSLCPTLTLDPCVRAPVGRWVRVHDRQQPTSTHDGPAVRAPRPVTTRVMLPDTMATLLFNIVSARVLDMRNRTVLSPCHGSRMPLCPVCLLVLASSAALVLFFKRAASTVLVNTRYIPHVCLLLMIGLLVRTRVDDLAVPITCLATQHATRRRPSAMHAQFLPRGRVQRSTNTRRQRAFMVAGQPCPLDWREN